MERNTWHVLVIDNNEEDYFITNQMLSKALEGTVHVDWAGSFDGGLEAMAGKQYDIVLVEAVLGECSGVELIRTAVSQGYPAPIILLTAHGSRAVDFEAMNAGAADYLCKEEVTPTSLERAIRYAIERKHHAFAYQNDLARAQAATQTGNWRLNVNQNTFMCSEETYRIFEVPAGTPMRYECFLTIVHPDDRNFVERTWQAALRGAPYDIEHRIHVKNTVKWVHVKAVLEFDELCNLKGVFGIIQDITERKRMEQVLRESLNHAAWVARISDETPYPITRVSMDGRLLYQNRAARQLPGWQCDFGERVDEWLLMLTAKAQQEGKIEQELQLAGRCYAICVVPVLEEGYINLYGRDVTAARRTNNEKMIREVTKRVQ